MRLIFVGLTALAVALAGCGDGSSGSATPTPKTLPRTLPSAATPGPPVTPPPGTRACTSGDLRSVVEAPTEINDAHGKARVDFFNASPTDCMLEGEPSIRLLDDRKAVIPAAITPGCDEPGASCPDEYPVLLGAGKTATAVVAGAIVLLDWTAPDSSTHCAAPIAYVSFVDAVIAGADVIAPFSPPQTKLVVCGTRMSVTRFESIPVAGDKILDLQPHPSPPPTPTPSPTPDITGVRSCTAADLKAMWFGEVPYNSAGSRAQINFADQSDTPCALRASPDIVLVGDDGGLASVRVSHSSACFPGLSCPEYPVPLLHPESTTENTSPTPTPNLNEYAHFEISWSNHTGAGWCENEKRTPLPKPTVTLTEVTFPDGGTVNVLPAPNRRDNFSEPDGHLQFSPCAAVVYVGPLWPASLSFGLSKFPQYPVDVTLQVGPHSVIYESATYDATVAITNKTAYPLTFDDPCPIATIEFTHGKPTDPDFRFTNRQQAPLDCDSQRTIAPGQAATFHYPVYVPTDLPGAATDWGLTWYLGDGTDPRAGVYGGSGIHAPYTPPPTPDHD